MKFCLGEQREINGHARRNCRACRAWYMREHRKTEKGKVTLKRHNDNQAATKVLAGEAKKKVFIEVRAGRLPNPSTLRCIDCGKWAQVYDHRDYSKPLAVVPVCRSCNALRGEGLNSSKKCSS